MSKVYIISDPHLGHENMAISRGFKDADEQTEYIVSKWNSVITKKDVVWILGDITMEKSSHYHILDRLNGIKKVVLGNHDQPQHVTELLKHVNSVCGAIKYKGYWLTHMPIHPNELRGLKNISGHVHLESIKDERYINVSCEKLNYTPILIDSLNTN